MTAITPHPQYARAIARWLLVCAMLVALMVFVGGVTRLTESGLSIVEWKLVSGTLPPMSDAAWAKEFSEYQTSPQFKHVNSGFTVEDFKRIYWLEYVHRLLGRLIGMAVLLPFLYFAARRRLPPRLLRRCAAIFLLIGAQGAVGWVMVASGLVDQPRVAPIKLGTHLLLAFGVFSLMLWTRWQVLEARLRSIAPPSRGSYQVRTADRTLIRAALTLLILQIFFGALVAGLRAGLTYNSWPLMDGAFIPDGLHLMTPWWKNHLENVMTVQFQHRMTAYLLVAVNLWLSLRTMQLPALRSPARLLLVATLSQLALGVATLLSHVAIPLASLHQLLALAVLAILLRLAYLTQINNA